MGAPFSNGTEGEMFIYNRCEKCRHRFLDDDGPCDDFMPAWLGEWPEILTRVETSAANPLGVECRKFEPGEASHPPTVAEVRASSLSGLVILPPQIDLDAPPYACD